MDDMLATNTQELHAFHLREMGHQYATVVTSEEVLRMLDEGKL